MKMRNLLFGVFLGLLTVVRSTPVVSLDDLDDFNREANTEDFLADEYLLPSLTTESPKRNATVPATQQPMSQSTDSDMTEGSGGEFMAHDATTTPTSTTTVLPDDANRVLQSGVTSPSEPDEALSTDDDGIEDTTVKSTTPMFILHEDEHYESTTPSVPRAQSSTSTPFPMPSDDFNSHSSGVTSPSEPDDALSTDDDVIEDTTVKSTTPMFILHEDEHYESTTPSVPHAQSSTSTPFPMPSDDFNSHSSGVTSPSEPDDSLSTDNDAIEDTTVKSTTPMFILHEDEHYESTTPSVPHAQSSTSKPFPMPSDDFNSHSSTTRAPQSGVTSTSDADDDLSTDNVSNDHNSASQATDAAIPSTDWSSGLSSGEGSGYMELFPSVTTRFSTTSTSTAKTSTTSPASEPGFVQVKKTEAKQNRAVLSGSKGHYIQPDTSDSPTNAGHSTPAWIIIVGFIVGVAALVMLCVAIATRDKWNGPRQASQAKANPSNQQRELEMETFLHKDNPRENGKAAEYTVIPLDELPEKYSSH